MDVVKKNHSAMLLEETLSKNMYDLYNHFYRMLLSYLLTLNQTIGQMVQKTFIRPD